MDRYVIREARVGANYPQGNQMMALSTSAGRNNMMPQDNVYFGGSYANQFPNMQHIPNSSFMDVGNINASVFGQNVHPGHGQIMTGIDPRYLANYSDNSAQFIVTGQPMQSETGHVSSDPSFGCNYQNRSFTGVEKNKPKTFTPQVIPPRIETPKNVSNFDGNVNSSGFPNKHINVQQEQVPQSPMKVTPKAAVSNTLKKENQNQMMSRADKLKALHKSGPRAFSGPVEKVLKWHKALQDIGVFVFYEIVAKCVSVRPGDSCSKNLVIRDDNGPAMQVVYYEIDFLLTELKIPSTVRVIGRMMAGTCRLQAFSVRPATGDDVATLPRRAAVAAHHVARLCKEYGMNV